MIVLMMDEALLLFRVILLGRVCAAVGLLFHLALVVLALRHPVAVFPGFARGFVLQGATRRKLLGRRRLLVLRRCTIGDGGE